MIILICSSMCKLEIWSSKNYFLFFNLQYPILILREFCRIHVERLIIRSETGQQFHCRSTPLSLICSVLNLVRIPNRDKSQNNREHCSLLGREAAKNRYRSHLFDAPKLPKVVMKVLAAAGSREGYSSIVVVLF